MAKYFGNIVKTGKLGGSVFAVRYGQTIERQYQPIVANPQTSAQVEARVKLKLLSQLAAIMTPHSGFKRVGSKTARNMFIKANYPDVSVSSSTGNPSLVDAVQELAAIKMTTGLLDLPSLTLTNNSTSVSVHLSVGANDDVDMVVYASYVIDESGNLIAKDLTRTDEPGNNRTFAATIPVDMNFVRRFVVYAYGISFRSDRARAQYQNMQVTNVSSEATLQAIRNMSENDALFTRSVFGGVQGEL